MLSPVSLFSLVVSIPLVKLLEAGSLQDKEQYQGQSGLAHISTAFRKTNYTATSWEEMNPTPRPLYQFDRSHGWR